MRLIGLAVICTIGATFAPIVIGAQPVDKVYRIGMLERTSAAINAANLEAFRQGLRALGYVEGKNLAIEYRSADGRDDRFGDLAAELVALKVDLILTRGTPAALASKRVTGGGIPVVITGVGDPIGQGIVASLAHPGGNITGLSTLFPEMSGKQLQVLKEIVPKISRVAVLGNATQPGNPQALREINLTADGVQIQYLEVRGPKDIETSFREASKERADAVLVLSTTILYFNRRQVSDLAVKSRLPTIYGRPEYVDDGGLVYYGPSYTDLYRRAAVYVDKILKGAKPADLPVEQPTKFELIINLKAAKQVGLTIPSRVLERANQVIK